MCVAMLPTHDGVIVEEGSGSVRCREKWVQDRVKDGRSHVRGGRNSAQQEGWGGGDSGTKSGL